MSLTINPSEEIKVMLVMDEELAAWVRELLFTSGDIRVVGSVDHGSEAIVAARDSTPHVLIVGPQLTDMSGPDFLFSQRGIVPTIYIEHGAVGANQSRQAFLAGAVEVLANPSRDDLAKAIRLVVQQARAVPESRQSESQILVGASPPSSKVAADGQLVVFYSAKGGCGTSSLAVWLALVAQRHLRQPTCLVDFDFLAGALDLRLGLAEAEERSLAKLHNDVSLDALMTRHGSGLYCIAAPPDIDTARSYTDTDIAYLFHELSTRFALTIVDSGPALTIQTAQALELASLVVVVMTPELPSIRHTKLLFRLLDDTGFPREKIQLVLSQTDSRLEKDLDIPGVESNFRQKISVRIPHIRDGFDHLIMSAGDAYNQESYTALEKFASHILGRLQPETVE